MVWPRQKDARGENTEIYCIMEWISWERRKRGRPKKKTWVEGLRAAMITKKFRARSMEKQRGMAFGFRKTATTVKNTGWLDGWMHGWMDR